MVKHLPPSAAFLRLVDVGGFAGEVFTDLRSDLEIILTPGAADEWSVKPNTIDAVVAFGNELSPQLLDSALEALRPAGRLIIVNKEGRPSQTLVNQLELAGYTRILVEAALTEPEPAGVLIRGEKPHTEAHTIDRVKQVAGTDAPSRGGRYVHVLIQQLPNKPPWKLKPDERVKWQAVAVEGQNETVLLAFSSLPKAVEFMQPAVLAGRIKEVNKIAKYRWEIARDWPFPIMLNPSDEIFDTNPPVYVSLDSQTAEAPDE